MPYITYLTTGSYDDTLASYTYSGTHTQRNHHSATENANYPNYSKNAYKFSETNDGTTKVTVAPFSNCGQGVPIGYTKSVEVRIQNMSIQRTVKGEDVSCGLQCGEYKSSLVTEIERGEEKINEKYTFQDPARSRPDTEHNNNLFANKQTVQIAQVTNIEYTTDGYTTTERLHKGQASYYITSQAIQVQGNRGQQVNGETYVTSSSWNPTYQGTIVVHKDASDDTTTYEVGTQRDNSKGERQQDFETITLTTRRGNTILKYNTLSFGVGDMRCVELKVIPYRRSNHDEDAYEDTVYVHTKHSYDKTTLYHWFSDSDPPDAFSEVSSTFVFDGSYFRSTGEATNTRTQPKQNNITLSSTTETEFTGANAGTKAPVGSTGSHSDDPKTENIMRTFYGRKEDGRSGGGTTHNAVTYDFMHQEVNNDEARFHTRRGMESDTNGKWVREIANSESEVTVMSSTLMPMHSPWDKSMHYAEEATRDMGSWRDQGNYTGVDFSSSAITITVRTAETLEIIRDQNPTDIESIEIPEITAEKHFHVGSNVGVNLPKWVQVLPTTGVTTQVNFDHGLIDDKNPMQFEKTLAVYELPSKVPYTDANGNTADADGRELFYVKYTATKKVQASDHYNLKDVTTGGQAVKYKDGQRDRFSFSEETTSPEVWYAKHFSSKGSQQFEQWGVGGEWGQYQINTASCVTTRASKTAYKNMKASYTSLEAQGGNSRKTPAVVKGFTDLGDENGSHDAQKTDYTATAGSTRTKQGKTSYDYKIKIWGREGSADRPYIVCHTYSSGYHGNVFIHSARTTGETYGGTSEQVYSVLAYGGLEVSDFKAYKNPLILTTGGWELGYRQQGDRAQPPVVNGSMFSAINGGIITRTYLTDAVVTYWESYQHTIYHDMDGWMEFCLSDYDSDTVITELNWNNLTDPFNMNGCYQVVYMDNCGNSKEFGVGMGSSGMGMSSGGMNQLQSYSYIDNNGDKQVLDQFGNPWNPPNSNNQPQKRDPSCDPYSWTFWSTFHHSTMTKEIKSSTVVSIKLEGSDIAPPYYGMQSYYGAMHYPVPRYTSGDIWLPQNGWFSPWNDTNAEFHGDWVQKIFDRNIGSVNYHFQFPQYAVGETPAFAFGREPPLRLFDTSFNNTQYVFLQARTEPLNFGLYEHIKNEDLIQPYLRSQKIYTRTEHCEGYNGHLQPFYAQGMGAEGDNYEMYQNHPEYRTNWVDGRRVIKKLILETKIFQKGVYAIAHSREDKTTSYNDVYVMETESLDARFTSDSGFYKDYLENTHFTLTSSGSHPNIRDRWFYKTSSQKISTLKSGNDGVWRAIRESGTSGTIPFSIESQRAESKTYLSGNFILGSSDPRYYLVHRQTFPIVQPDCCGCKTYHTFNEQKWTKGGQVDNFSRDIGGQYRAKHENVIGGHLTVAMLPVSPHVNFDSFDHIPLPIRLYRKSMNVATWSYNDLFANLPPAGSDIMSLDNEIISYEVPEMYLMHPHKPFGVELKNHSTFTIDYFLHIKRPCIYDKYERIGVDVNILEAYLNAHNQYSFMGSYIEEVAYGEWSEYPELLINRRIQRNQSTRQNTGDDYVDYHMVHVNDTNYARLQNAQPEALKHPAIGRQPSGLDYYITSEFNKYAMFHTTE